MIGEATPALQVSNIAKHFGATVALDGVDFTLCPGEVHALIGENGAGKSTLMNIVVGALRPDRGEMQLEGAAYAPGSPLDARRSGVALIHQELSLCPHLSVEENILLGAERSRAGVIDRRAARARVSEVLETFGHADIDPARPVGKMSVAARQVVEICRALAADARILLMDEPTSSLRREDVERLFALIQKLCAQGIGVVYISHFLEEVRQVAQRYTVLRDGRSVDCGDVASVTNDRLIAAMVGRPIERLFPQRSHPADAAVLLEVRELTAPPGLRSASFALRRGEIMGIAGLMGSGRTEMVRALFGLDPAAAGAIELHGKAFALRGGKPADRIGQGFGYLSEDRAGEALALPLSIADNITLTRLGSLARFIGWLDLRRQVERANDWVQRLRIRTRSPRQAVRTLSGGNQQKVVIARLLYQEADVLLLDEPTRGIDIGSKAQVYEAVARAAEDGKGVLLVSSYLPELFGMCDRLAVMSRGWLSPARPINEWTPETVLAAAIET